MKCLAFNILCIFFTNFIFAQITYNNLAQKPIGHNIAQTTLWRFAIKKPKKEPSERIVTDTVFNADGTIKEIHEVLHFLHSSADYDYPDTLIEEKNTYNTKGFLIFKEEPYHIHVDQPCRLTEEYTYDNQNRILTQNVFECDTFWHYQYKNKYNDVLRQFTLIKVEDNEEVTCAIRKFDAENRQTESFFYSVGDTVPYMGMKKKFLRKGRLVKQTNYEEGKVNGVYYIFYNKLGQKIKQLTVDDIVIDSLSPPDTMATNIKYFWYNKNHNLIREEEYKKYPERLIEKQVYQYNANNQVISWHKINTEYKTDVTTNYYYRPDGLPDYYDVFNDSTTQYRYKYEYLFYNQPLNIDTLTAYTNSDDLLELYLYKTKTEVFGTHCFHTPNHAEIDCCLENTKNSFALTQQPNGTFSGNINSCFDDTQHNISMSFKANKLTLQITDDTYTFFGQNVSPIIFTKRKNKK